jgi:hypothetical protein
MKSNFGPDRHAPRARSIQYRRARMIDRRCPGIPDHPHARVITRLVGIRPTNLESSEQQQDQQNDDDKAEAAATVISGAIEWAATYAAEAAEQRDNKNNKNDCSNGHAAISSSPGSRHLFALP